MTSFYLDDCEKGWTRCLASGRWLMEANGDLRRIRYWHGERAKGVAVVTSRELYILRGGEGEIPDSKQLAAEFWRLARLLPGQGFRDVLRAMPQNTHPPED